jgi:predicted kinase
MYGTLFVYAGPTGVGKTQDAASCFLDSSVVSLSAIHREAYGSPVVERQHKDAVTRRAFKKLFALLERGLDAVFIAPNCSRMSRAHLYREVKSRFPGVRVVVVLVHMPLADILKRPNGVSASHVRGEYLGLQIPRVGVDCDVFTLQAPDFSAYLPEINQSYLVAHNSPYHVESIAEHVALTVHNARKETARPALVDIAAFHDLGKSVARTPQDTSRRSSAYIASIYGSHDQYAGHENVSAVYWMIAHKDCLDSHALFVAEAIVHHMQAHRGFTDKYIKRHHLDTELLETARAFARIDSKSKILDKDIMNTYMRLRAAEKQRA